MEDLTTKIEQNEQFQEFWETKLEPLLFDQSSQPSDLEGKIHRAVVFDLLGHTPLPKITNY